MAINKKHDGKTEVVGGSRPEWGTNRKVFILGYSCTQRFPRRNCLLLGLYKLLNRVLIKEAILIEQDSFSHVLHLSFL